MNKRGGHFSPHKVVMMLAVMDLIASGETDGNRIVYGPELLEHFRSYFDVVKTDADSCTPLNPFFYLRSEPFWHHHAVPGKEAVCEALSSPGGSKKLAEVIDFVFLDDELFAALQNVSLRKEIREAVICRYFPAMHETLSRLADKEESVGLYAQVLRGELKEAGRVKEDSVVRDLAFARVVKRAYHYQCAACGLRILFDGISLVDAAHIIPFATSHDDNPCNGISLCKNHHWAMDHEMIFPCTDNKWHVHKDLDDRMDARRSLISLHGKSIILPEQQQFAPKQESLEWRERRLNSL